MKPYNVVNDVRPSNVPSGTDVIALSVSQLGNKIEQVRVSIQQLLHVLSKQIQVN